MVHTDGRPTIAWAEPPRAPTLAELEARLKTATDGRRVARAEFDAAYDAFAAAYPKAH